MLILLSYAHILNVQRDQKLINLLKKNLNKALVALIFSFITIGILSYLSFQVKYGIFLTGSFGSSMVLMFGYPESPFSQPKNVFFGHLVTSTIGVLALMYLPIDQYLQIALAVAFGIFFMILLGITHPPAGGNPIVIILSAATYKFLLFPIISGAIIIILAAIIFHRFILKEHYPLSWKK